MRIPIVTSLILLIALVTNSDAATYRATFTGTWSANDITSTYPASAHFTELIGATHTASTVIWQPGATASPGIEDVAELGSNFTLRSELQALRQAGQVGDTIELQSLFNLPNSSRINFNVDNSKPFLSLISMIAPSPDWFVGVYNLPLTDSDGTWRTSITVDLRPYDAGTEKGTTFSLSNPPTTGGVIAPLDGTESPFIGRPVIARLELTLLNPLPPIDPPVQPPSIDLNNARRLMPIITLVLETDGSDVTN